MESSTHQHEQKHSKSSQAQRHGSLQVLVVWIQFLFQTVLILVLLINFEKLVLHIAGTRAESRMAADHVSSLLPEMEPGCCAVFLGCNGRRLPDFCFKSEGYLRKPI